jgi:hypothetical protein
MSDAAVRLGRRAGIDPHFLAFALTEFAAAERLDDPAAAALLGTTVEVLARLRLCPAPRPDPAGFADDIERLAARFDLNREALIRVARFGQVIATLRPDPAAADPEPVPPFLAARDQPS